MSMKDIRSFFKPLSKTPVPSKSLSSGPGTSNLDSHKHLDSKSVTLESRQGRMKEISSSTKKAPKKKSKETEKIKYQLNSLDSEDLLTEKKIIESSISIDSSGGEDVHIENDAVGQSNKSFPKQHASLNLKKLVNVMNDHSKMEVTEIIRDSDDSNIINATPERSFKPKRRKIQILSSDSEDEKPQSVLIKTDLKKKGDVLEELKPVCIADIFGTEVKQSKAATPWFHGSKKTETIKSKKNRKEIILKNKKDTELDVHKDKHFEQTLMDLDDEIFLQNEDILDKTIENAVQKSPSKINNSTLSIAQNKVDQSLITDQEISVPNYKADVSKKRTLDSQKKEQDDDTPNRSKRVKLEHTDSGFDDQDRYEKKRYLYQQYLNRSAPKHYGEKQYPTGKPDCLSNLCFLKTGVLDSLESKEFQDLIKKHGGRTVHAVSKKVNYVVVGDEPGPAKLQKAGNYGIPTINEDELLDMILQKSGMPKKYTVSKASSFEDAGMNDSFCSNKSEEATHVKDEVLKTDKNSGDELSLMELNEKKNQVKVPEEKILQKLKKDIEFEGEPTEYTKKKSLQFNSDDVCLSEKYRPKDLKQIVGQQLDNSNMNKLKKWLQLWHQSEKLRKQNKIPRPSPWDKNSDGLYYKCALLSGPPGVGKTTTATLVAESLGFDIVEYNASDTRSKKLLQVEVAAALSTQNISSFNMNSRGLDNKRVILMDEVDGMAGNEDRGGMQELILLIKNSKIPIICMCNDRNHQKIRTLANYCFDLRFDKPKPQQILGFVMSICCKEGIKVSPQVVTEIINGTSCDIRQTLNQISMIDVEAQISIDEAKAVSHAARKDTILGPWQVCKMVFNETDQKNMSVIDKSRLFFYDYSLGPLFVQENYLKVQPKVNRKMTMKHVAAAAEAISMGATIEKKIRESNNWSLLDMQAIYSSVLPGYHMSGNFTGPIDFPGWLGKNSKRNKLKRLNNELAVHTKIHTSGGALAMILDYSKALLRSIVIPLKKKGSNGVTDAIEVMKSYQLLREDLDSLVELSTWPKQKNIMDGISSTVKGAFTRLYKKEVPLFSYSANTGISKKRPASYEDELNEDENDEQSEQEETIENDNLIKQKAKPRTQKKDSAKSTSLKQGSKSKEKKKK